MKSMVHKYLKQIDWDVVKISSFLIILFYGVNFSIEYATDTYSTFQEADTWKWMLYENGRLINAALYYVIEKLQIPNGYVYKLSYLLAIFCLAIATYILAKLLNKFCVNKFLCTITSFLTLSNFLIIEYFLFIEKGMFMLAILLCTLAAYFTVQFFEKGNKGYILGTFFCLLFAVFIYQLMLALYVVLCLPFIVKYSDNLKKFILNNMLVASLYALPLIIAFVITKFGLKSSRMGAGGNVLENVLGLLPTIWNISTKQWFHMPEYVFAICLILVLSLVFVCILFIKSNVSKGYSFGVLLYVIIGTVFTAFFPGITGIGDIYAPRTLYAFGCIFGILVINVILMYCKESKGPMLSLLATIVVIILGLQYLNFSSVFIERYKANQADKYYCEIIGEKIKEYEADTGIIIDTICFYEDISIAWYDAGCDETMQSPRAQSCGWSNLTALNMYLDKTYVKGEPYSGYIDYFGQYNWDTYSDKQVVFDGNVLHLCVY